jgi:Mce-associated membrane protein
MTLPSDDTSKDAKKDPEKDSTEPTAAKDSKTSQSSATSEESGLPRLLLTAAVALVVAATAVAGWFGVAWFRAANDDSLAYSSLRDEVNRVAQNAVVTMNTLDYRKVDQGLADWAAATTGKLHDQIVQADKTSRDAIVEVQSVTRATPLASGVAELDERAGQATVLVSLRTNVTVKGQEPTDKYQRFVATMQRTEDGWKLAEIGSVPPPPQAGQ